MQQLPPKKQSILLRMQSMLDRELLTCQACNQLFNKNERSPIPCENSDCPTTICLECIMDGKTCKCKTTGLAGNNCPPNNDEVLSPINEPESEKVISEKILQEIPNIDIEALEVAYEEKKQKLQEDEVNFKEFLKPFQEGIAKIYPKLQFLEEIRNAHDSKKTQSMKDEAKEKCEKIAKGEIENDFNMTIEEITSFIQMEKKCFDHDLNRAKCLRDPQRYREGIGKATFQKHDDQIRMINTILDALKLLKDPNLQDDLNGLLLGERNRAKGHFEELQKYRQSPSEGEESQNNMEKASKHGKKICKSPSFQPKVTKGSESKTRNPKNNRERRIVLKTNEDNYEKEEANPFEEENGDSTPLVSKRRRGILIDNEEEEKTDSQKEDPYFDWHDKKIENEAPIKKNQKDLSSVASAKGRLKKMKNVQHCHEGQSYGDGGENNKENLEETENMDFNKIWEEKKQDTENQGERGNIHEGTERNNYTQSFANGQFSTEKETRRKAALKMLVKETNQPSHRSQRKISFEELE